MKPGGWAFREHGLIGWDFVAFPPLFTARWTVGRVLVSFADSSTAEFCGAMDDSQRL